ncbi:peptidoglycan-binding protein, partial [Streptosporangium algeriense]
YGYATSCPGGPLYAWVRAGAPRPAEKKPTPTLEEALVKKLPVLKKGDRGWDVKTVHYLLLARDCANIDGRDDTVFTTAHEQGVRGLQAAAGITVDGIVGPATWPVLLRIA